MLTIDRDYPSCDKSLEAKGFTRMIRYNNLINASSQLQSLADYKGSIYNCEPFYQLMRQALWAEQMLVHKATERVKADHFMHIHIIPKADVDLLDKKYRLTGKRMEETWRSMISDHSIYIIVDPKDFLSSIQDSYPELWVYLNKRYYWNSCSKN